jgi:predicted dehydrogenase
VKLSGYSTNQGHNYEASDYTRLDVLFEQNIFLNGQWSFAVHESADKENCEIIGTRGKISFSFFRSPVLEIYTGNGCLKMEFPFPENIQHPMIEKVVGFFRGKNENPCSLREALESIQMLDATVASF